MAKLRHIAAGAAALAFVAAAAAAASASPQASNTAPGKSYVATQEITVDKETGTRRKPNAAEVKELVSSLTSLLAAPSETLRSTTLASGAVAMEVDGRSTPVVLAKPKADGTTEVRCVTSFEEALEFLGLVEAPPQQ